jgi:hypothetical protein
MRADRDDRLTSNSADNQRRHGTQTLITAIAVLILAAGAYLMAPDDDAEAPATETPASSPPAVTRTLPPRPDPALAVREAPDIPEAEPVIEAPAEEPAEPETGREEAPQGTGVAVSEPAEPTPEELDAQLRRAMADAGFSVAAPLEGSVNAPYLLDRGASSVDQLARGLVPRRTLNLPRPRGSFPVQRDGQAYRVDPAGYDRYDRIVAAITALPVDTLAMLFQRFRGQLGDAYASLGYPEDAMDNTLIAALDAVISAPIREEPPLLSSKGALWSYADAELENSSDLHRQLLRTGPDNTRELQRWARRMRDALLER